MYGYFTFEADDSSNRRCLIVFCATGAPTADDVVSVVHRRAERSLLPESILLLGFSSEQSAITEIAADERLSDHLPTHVRSGGSGAVRASVIPRTGLTDSTDLHGLSWGAIKRAGLIRIFAGRNALLVSPSTHHFAKPSGRHCSRFIRAANAMVDGAEIVFIAGCCLGHVPAEINHFYCDTGGISSLAFAIDSLRRRFDKDAVPGTVNTFESYDGLRRFEFVDCEKSLVLISASTSLELERAVLSREPGFRPSQIITVFCAAAATSGSHVLLNVLESSTLGLSAADFASFEENECPACGRGSVAVPFVGEQFIPARSDTRAILIKATHAPPWLQRILAMVIGTGQLSAFYRNSNTRHASQDVFIDMERVLDEDPPLSDLAKRIARLIEQEVPAATTRIVHLPDEGSRLLALRCRSLLEKLRGGNIPTLISHPGDSIDADETNGATLVVSGVIASGQSLLSISQRLRNFVKGGSLAYLVGVSRTAMSQDIARLESDLRMGDSPSDYGLAIAERVFLPVVARGVRCSWEDELALLQEIEKVAGNAARGEIENRIGALLDAGAKNVRGLRDNLFWPSSTGMSLKVRDGFVFFPKKVSGSPSQADVYSCVVAVLHHLRSGSGADASLRQTEYERRVISPLCFDRYNDGVIQASFLRAASRPELDYSASSAESGVMLGVLREILAASDSEKGEASLEFVLALALERLVLWPDDMKSLCAEFAVGEGDSVARLLWDRIRAAH